MHYLQGFRGHRNPSVAHGIEYGERRRRLRRAQDAGQVREAQPFSGMEGVPYTVVRHGEVDLQPVCLPRQAPEDSEQIWKGSLTPEAPYSSSHY